MAIFDSFFPEQPSYLTGLLGEDEALKARQQAQQAGLLNTGLGLLMASGPSTQRQGLGQILAQGIMTGQQAYQGAYDKQLKDKVMAMQVGEMKRKLEEDAAYRRIAPQLFKTTPEQATYGAGEEGPTKTVTAPATQTLDPEMLQKLALIAPERAKTIAETQTALRKAGLGVKTPGSEMDNPFLPFTMAASPQVKTLAAQYSKGYKEGRITDEMADKYAQTLASMDQNYGNQELTKQLTALRIDEANAKNLQAKDGKQLPPNAINDLSNKSDSVTQVNRLKDSFKTDFGGFISDTAGEAVIAIRKRSDKPEMVEMTQWWQDYQTYKNKVRNELFGASLTAPEKAEFEKAVVTPGMKPAQIEANLKRQAELASQAYEKISKAYVTAGYSKSTIESLNPNTMPKAPEAPQLNIPSISAIDAELAKRKKK